MFRPLGFPCFGSGCGKMVKAYNSPLWIILWIIWISHRPIQTYTDNHTIQLSQNVNNQYDQWTIKRTYTIKFVFVHRKNSSYLSRASKTIINKPWRRRKPLAKTGLWLIWIKNDRVFYHIRYQLYCLCFLCPCSLLKRTARKKIHRSTLRVRFKRATQNRLRSLFRTNPNNPQARIANIIGVELPALGTRRWKAGPFPGIFIISLTVVINAWVKLWFIAFSPPLSKAISCSARVGPENPHG